MYDKLISVANSAYQNDSFEQSTLLSNHLKIHTKSMYEKSIELFR